MKKQFIALCALILVFAVNVLTASEQTSPKYGIEQYLKVRAASSPSFSPDGRRVAFLLNQTGTNQIWLVPTSGDATPKQLTNYEDNISFVKFSPTEDAILFGKAAGGDENTQFFIMQADGSSVRQLISDASVRNNFGEWTADGTRIFYSSNKQPRSKLTKHYIQSE